MSPSAFQRRMMLLAFSTNSRYFRSLCSRRSSARRRSETSMPTPIRHIFSSNITRRPVKKCSVARPFFGKNAASTEDSPFANTSAIRSSTRRLFLLREEIEGIHVGDLVSAVAGYDFEIPVPAQETSGGIVEINDAGHALDHRIGELLFAAQCPLGLAARLVARPGCRARRRGRWQLPPAARPPCP